MNDLVWDFSKRPKSQIPRAAKSHWFFWTFLSLTFRDCRMCTKRCAIPEGMLLKGKKCMPMRWRLQASSLCGSCSETQGSLVGMQCPTLETKVSISSLMVIVTTMYWPMQKSLLQACTSVYIYSWALINLPSPLTCCIFPTNHCCWRCWRCWLLLGLACFGGLNVVNSSCFYMA